MNEDLDAALKRLGSKTEAREYLRPLLLAELQSLSGPDLSDGAVRYREGRRSHAWELIVKLGLTDDYGLGNATIVSGAATGARNAGRSLVRVADTADTADTSDADPRSAGRSRSKRDRSPRRPR